MKQIYFEFKFKEKLMQTLIALMAIKLFKQLMSDLIIIESLKIQLLNKSQIFNAFNRRLVSSKHLINDL